MNSVNIKQSEIGVDNKTFLITIDLENRFILKQYTKRNYLDVSRIANLQNTLSDNELLVPKSFTLSGSTVMMQEFMNGHHLSRLTNKHLARIAELLFTIHRCKIPLKLISRSKKFDYQNYFQLCKKWYKIATIKKIYSKIDQSYRKKLPTTFIHGDISPANLLFSKKGNIVGILDWDHACIGPRIYDIARSQIFFGFHHGTVYDAKRTSTFLKSYGNLSKLEEDNIHLEIQLALIKMILETYYAVEVMKNVPKSSLKNDYQDLSIGVLFDKLLGIFKR